MVRDVRANPILLLCWTVVSASMTINDPLQEALNQTMKNRPGAAVALDVETGRIVASYHMDVAARRVASPGSTVKPFTLMALLKAGLVSESTAFFCPAKPPYHPPNKAPAPRAARATNSGTVTSQTIAPWSMSVSAWRKPLIFPATQPPTVSPDPRRACPDGLDDLLAASRQLSPDLLYRAFSEAGFNSLTGKWPTEVAGTVQQPASQEAVELMSIGEDGVAVTPLALAEAYRTLALGLRNPQQAAELQLIVKGLERAVKEGTAQLAASKEMRVAGKTGTSGGHAWFVGFAPAEHPEIVVLVFLERGRGGADAAPIAGRVFGAYSVWHKGNVRP